MQKNLKKIFKLHPKLSCSIIFNILDLLIIHKLRENNINNILEAQIKIYIRY